MHQGDAWLVVVDSVLDGCTNDASRTFLGYGLDADARGVGESNLVNAHLVLQEIDDALHFVAFRFPFNARIDVFAVLSEDDHVNVLGRLDR